MNNKNFNFIENFEDWKSINTRSKKETETEFNTRNVDNILDEHGDTQFYYEINLDKLINSMQEINRNIPQFIEPELISKYSKHRLKNYYQYVMEFKSKMDIIFKLHHRHTLMYNHLESFLESYPKDLLIKM